MYFLKQNRCIFLEKKIVDFKFDKKLKCVL